MEALLKYEREPFFEPVGSKQSKISFLQSFPMVANFKKDSTVFYCAGIYQLEDGPPIIVMPWFMKTGNKFQSQSESDHQTSVFMGVERNPDFSRCIDGP